MRTEEKVEPPVSSFRSKGGRTFTIIPGNREYGIRGESWKWLIYYGNQGAGLLFRNSNYRPPLEWSASTRMLFWTHAVGAPLGVGNDVAAFVTLEECLEAWAQSADQILDWEEGKEVYSAYGPVRKRV